MESIPVHNKNSSVWTLCSLYLYLASVADRGFILRVYLIILLSMKKKVSHAALQESMFVQDDLLQSSVDRSFLYWESYSSVIPF